MKRSIVLVLVTGILAALALTVSPAAMAQPQPGIGIPATCTDPATGADIDCVLP